MAGYRSEADRVPNKQNYKEYNLTHYPNNLDTRSNNTNMRGFINIGETEGIPDYVMAEYVNSAMDAIMSLERALGKTPMLYEDVKQIEVNNLIETFTVSDRISRIENGLFDERYGGKGWEYTPNRPVLNNHKHNGIGNNPPKIDLSTDVSGKLKRENIDLNHQTGLTGAHISLSPSNSTKINDAIKDALSKTEGGTVSGDVSFTGAVKTRTSIDATTTDIRNKGQSNIVSDVEATSGQALTSGNVTTQRRIFTIEARDKEHLLFGRYVLGVRIKKGNNSSESSGLVEFTLGGRRETIQEKDLESNYRMVHFVFEHNQSTKQDSLTLNKLATSDSKEIIVDSYYIVPIHPATLDR